MSLPTEIIVETTLHPVFPSFFLSAQILPRNSRPTMMKTSVELEIGMESGP
jgi:hypothetical protein